MNITTSHFREIYREVIDKFSKDFVAQYKTTRPTETQTFKLKGYDKDKITLEDSLNSHPEVVSYRARKSIFKSEEAYLGKSNYLYKKMKRIEKEEKKMGTSSLTQISVNAPYSEILFLYLGYKDYEEFKANRNSTETSYRGFYYSYIKHQICEYKLSINYDRKPNYPGINKQDYVVQQEGYHDNDGERKYEGYAYNLEKKLQIIMWSNIDEDRLRIFLEAGDKPSSKFSMRGVIVAVASYNPFPITSTETVIIKKDAPSLTNREILSIKRYLLLHQNNFRINAGTMNLQMMKSKGVSVDIMVPFVGVWRTYRFDEEFEKVICSYLWVTEDYRITCFTKEYEDLPNFQEQVCLPDLTTYDLLNTRTIILRSYPKQGARIISSTMINIPRMKELELQGTISFIGQDGHIPFSRTIIMVRDEQLSENAIDNALVTEESIITEIKVHLNANSKETREKADDIRSKLSKFEASNYDKLKPTTD